jgi:hypothetical protein
MLGSSLEPSTHNTGLERYRPVNLPSTTAYVGEDGTERASGGCDDWVSGWAVGEGFGLR